MDINLPRPMEFARQMSQLSEFDQRFKMGAVVAKKNRILGLGFNKLKTAGSKYPNLFSVHAEISAIINAKPYKTNLDNAYIYVYRETCDEIPGLAHPCKTCMGAIAESKISRIYYSINHWPYWEIIYL